MLISDVYLNGFFKFSNHGLSEGVRLPFGKPSHPIHVGHHGAFLLSAQKGQKFIEICRDQLKFLFLLEVSINFVSLLWRLYLLILVSFGLKKFLGLRGLLNVLKLKDC